MSNQQATIKSGIGYYDAPKDAAMLYDPSMEFLSAHCTHQELFQDIRNIINKVFDYEAKVWRRFAYINAHPKLFTQVRMYDAHKVVHILVGMITPNSQGVWINNRIIKRDLYLSITDEGLITDVLTKPPNMNPGNGRPVTANKW